MRDISARELKGHNILAVERFQDNTRRMIEFSVLRSCAYGSPGDEMRLFLTEDGYQAALVSQKRREIKIRPVSSRDTSSILSRTSTAATHKQAITAKGKD